LELRRVTRADCDVLFHWYNDIVTRRNSFRPEPIKYEEHVVWLEKKLADNSCVIYIGKDGDNLVGQVRFDMQMGVAEVSISVDKNHRQKGHGAILLDMGCKEMFEKVKEVHAFVKPRNTASRKLFEKCGFRIASFTVRNKQDALLYIKEKEKRNTRML